MLACASAGARYYVYATTWDRTHAGTDSDIYIRVHGMKGMTSWYEMDLSGTDDFTRGDTDYYSFWRNEDVGDIMCVEMHTGGSDALLVYKIKIKSTTCSGWKNIFNKKGQWLSRDRDEGITQDKWCLDDCAVDLPLSKAWQLDSTSFELPKAEVSNLAPSILDSHVMDATNSSQDIETEYFASGYATKKIMFSKTAGVYVSGSLAFSSNVVEVQNGTAQVDDSTNVDFTLGVWHAEATGQSSWFGCRAPAGKKVRCSAQMDRVLIEAPFTQAWKRGKCVWTISGGFSRIEDGALYQHIEEIA